MARPKSTGLNAPWKENDRCPCGSRMDYGDCCLNHDGQPLIKTPSLTPDGPITKYENGKCYLNFTKNCSQKISREHYVSKSILSQFGGLAVKGMPWQTPGTSDRYSPNNLTSHILCDRHNKSLSPLDKAASHFFKEVFAATHHATKKSISGQSKYFMASGDALELWALKTMVGLFYAKIAQSKGVTMLGNYNFDHKILENAFYGIGIAEPKGVYVKERLGDLINVDLEFCPLSVVNPHTICGIKFGVSGFEFEFLFDVRYARQEFFNESLSRYRPWILDLAGKKRTSRIILTWEKQREGGKRLNLNLIPGKAPK